MGFYGRLLASIQKHPQGRWTPEVEAIINQEKDIFKEPLTLEEKQGIPEGDFPLHGTKWFKIPDIICCYVDMKGSTQLSATAHPFSTAKFYRLFTGTAVRIFDELEAKYIDVKGDGVFALFDKNQTHRALAATVAFKTFVEAVFIPETRAKNLDIDGHYGIDRRQVLVRRLGLRTRAGQTLRSNEVWAGKPVNMAAKLASRTAGGEILVSDRYHRTLTDDAATLTCGCGSGGVRGPLWSPVDLSHETMFDFSTAYSLKSGWCSTHGRQFCAHLLEADNP